MRDVLRLTDLWPPRLVARWRCHHNVQRCQYVDRPDDNQGMTWIDRVWFRWTGADPDDYGYG